MMVWRGTGTAWARAGREEEEAWQREGGEREAGGNVYGEGVP